MKNEYIALAIVFVFLAIMFSVMQSTELKKVEQTAWIEQAPQNILFQAWMWRMVYLGVGIVAVSASVFAGGVLMIGLRDRWIYPTIHRHRPTVTQNWIYDPMTGNALRIGDDALPQIAQAQALAVAEDRGRWVKAGLQALEVLRELPQETLPPKALTVLREVENDV